jgi:hypothetical protein
VQVCHDCLCKRPYYRLGKYRAQERAFVHPRQPDICGRTPHESWAKSRAIHSGCLDPGRGLLRDCGICHF